MRIEDFPPKIRAQLETKYGQALTRQPTRRSQRVSTAPGTGWRCAAPGCPFDTTVWAHAERHADDVGHHRIGCVL